LDWTYNTIAIEGNSLTLFETKVVLEGITIGGKTLREHLEVINHKEAILYVEDIVQKKDPISERQIKNIHRLILKGNDNENAGAYRKENVVISGAKHIPPEALQVSIQMENQISMYENEWTSLYPVERAVYLHILLEYIHLWMGMGEQQGYY
jgi:Fic family protein